MTAATQTTPAMVRDGRGRFLPGRSGNPAGKPPGTLNRTTLWRRFIETDEDHAAARVVIDKAVGGDLVAARYLMDRLEPKPRTRPIPIDLAADAPVATGYEAVHAAFAGGLISPDEAMTAARFLERLGLMRGEVAAQAEAHARAQAEIAGLRAELAALKQELAALRAALPAAPAAAPPDLNSACIATPASAARVAARVTPPGAPDPRPVAAAAPPPATDAHLNPSSIVTPPLAPAPARTGRRRRTPPPWQVAAPGLYSTPAGEPRRAP